MDQGEIALKHPMITEDTPVFDKSHFGRHVAAEREDETGAELLEEDVVFDLAEDLFGDWSWKPDRYSQDPGRVFTDEEIEALYPNREYRPNAR